MMLPELVQRSALRNPDKVALRDASEVVTYRDLDRRANRLARALVDLEVRPGDRVAVWLDRSVASVVAGQAILRLGAVHVPVDPAAGPGRTGELLIDAGPRVLISTDARAGEVLKGALSHVTCLATDRTQRGISWSETDAYASDPIEEDILTSPSDVAALLYPWSATTGGKGICLSHAALLASATWLAAELPVASSDCLAGQAPPADLLALVDQHAAFLMGASLSLVPGTLQDPRAVLAFLANQQATAWTTHAAVLDAAGLSGLEPSPASTVRRVLVSGDPPEPDRLRAVAEMLPGARVLGVLGAPETGLCAWYEPGTGPADEVPVGEACAGARMWAIGRDGEEVSIGEEGELVVQGPTVFLGHWGRPSRGGLPYFTGRIVRREDTQRYTWVGRRGGAVVAQRASRPQPVERV